MTARPHQLRHDPALCAAISGALDAVLAQHPERAAEARQARHERLVRSALASTGHALDQALIRREAIRLGPMIDRWDARHDLAAALAADDWKRERERRFEAASRLGRTQGRTRALREHFAASADASRALVASLDRRIAQQPRVRFFAVARP